MTLNPQINIVRIHRKEALFYAVTQLGLFCSLDPSCMTLNPQVNIVRTHHKEALFYAVTQLRLFCSLDPSLHDTKSTSCKRHVVMGIYVFENCNLSFILRS